MMERVVIIPGWAFPAASMQGLARRIESRFEVPVSVLDHGTPSPNEDPGAPGHERVLSRILRQIEKLDQPHTFMGWSMGGRIALEIALRRPERVSSLILVCTSARFCRDTDFPHGYALANVRALGRNLRNSPEQALRGFFSNATTASTFGDKYVENNVRKALEHGTGPLLDGLSYLQTIDHRARLSQILAPALVLHGGEDTLVPWQAGQALAEGLVNGHFAMHDAAGHDLLLTHSAWMFDAVDAWQKSLSAKT